MEVARHVQSMQNRKLVIFLQYLKKKVLTAFVFYCDPKYLDILQGSNHVLCYLLLLLLILLLLFGWAGGEYLNYASVN